jgi:hypothetical protein
VPNAQVSIWAGSSSRLDSRLVEAGSILLARIYGERRMRVVSSGVAVCFSMAFIGSGCGTHVPDMALSADPYATQNLLLGVITHIKAELECAVFSLYTEDQIDSKAKRVPPTLSWLATGSGKATITLTADEKSIFNPTAIYLQNFPTVSQTFLNKSIVTTPRNFGLAGGANVSSDATRVIQVGYTFDFARDFFADPKLKNPDEIKYVCSPYSGVLIDGDLKIYDSFRAILLPYELTPENMTADIKFLSGTPGALSATAGTSPKTPGTSSTTPGTQSTMQTHITFILAATGNVTPAWKLVPVSYNVSSNPFFQMGRTTTDDVIVTIGKKAPEVAQAHDITKIGIQNNIFINSQ